MDIPWACLSIRLPLIALVLVVTFPRIGALICLVTKLVAVEAWLVVPWPS
jgi:hypothetical protein